jgi:hypothetical protein
LVCVRKDCPVRGGFRAEQAVPRMGDGRMAPLAGDWFIRWLLRHPCGP